jgi:two-component system cell cycle sensor histidine kinase/response regulator CckA
MPSIPTDSVREIELYRNLAERGRELICQAGVTGRYLYVSPNCQQILGYQPEELIGQSLFNFVHPDDLPGVNRLYVLGLITHQPAQLQFRYRRKNGEWCWLETNGQPFFGWGGLWRATLILRDITQFRRMEEQLRQVHDFRDSILTGTSNVVAAVDSDGRFLLVNSRLCELAGCHAEGLKGEDFLTRLAPEDQQAARTALHDVVTKKMPQSRCEVSLLHQQGGERRILLIMSPLLVEGRLTGVVLNGEDLTELRQSEENREYLLRQLQIAQKLESIGKMSAGVAHDFNNVLAGALSTTELLKSELADRPDLSRLLSLQQRAMERASHLTQQLLAFSRHEKIIAGPVDLPSRVRDLLEFCSTQFDKRIEVTNWIASDLPPVLGDGGQVDQILLNLLLNAGQALVAVADEGRLPRITVDARVESLSPQLAQNHGLTAGQTMLHLFIRDNGPGIPAALQAQIFDPFFTTKSPMQNHGLGLSTTHALVKNHEGAIEVESRLGHETVFHVYLPVCDEAARKIPSDLDGIPMPKAPAPVVRAPGNLMSGKP